MATSADVMTILAALFSDGTINYLANFTTVVVNGALIYGAIYAFVLRRKAFLAWLEKVYAAIVDLVSELRESNRLARAQPAPPSAPEPPPSPSEPTSAATIATPPPAPPLQPPARATVVATPGVTEPAEQERPKQHGWLPWIVGFLVAAVIVFVALVYVWSRPEQSRAETSTRGEVEAREETVTSPPMLPPVQTQTWAYVVREGDSCWRIAERASNNALEAYELCSRIQALNPKVKKWSQIRPGEEILIPADVQQAKLIGQ
jgi:hypothetical protein